MNDRYDIIVIGAGPGGSAAAAAAAKAGRRVCLVERKQTAGYPVRCGEGIGYKGLTLTLEPQPGWIKGYLTGAAMVSPSGIRVDIKNVDKSCILNREKMDADLAQTAADNGAQYFTSTTITSISRSQSGLYTCNGTSTNANVGAIAPIARNTDVNLSAPILIIADGVESRLARCLGWNTTLRKSDIETCAFARVKSPDIDQETCVFHVGSKTAPGGYLWIFPRGNGEANVGLGVIGSRCTKGLPKKLLLEHIEKMFPNATVSDLHCGGVPVAKWIRPLVKDGAMLVGDAARQVNAVSGAGIAYALYAGKTAGEKAAKAFRQDGTIDYAVLTEYQKEWEKGLGKDQDRSFALKEFIMSTDDKFLDKIAAALSKEDPMKINYRRVFMRTFLSKPLLLIKAFKLFR